MVCALTVVDAVTVTEQVLGLPPLSVQLAALKLSPALELIVTVPVGVALVPVSLSLTVTVAVVDCPTCRVDALRLTLVAVVRGCTVSVFVPLLVLWVLSPL